MKMNVILWIAQILLAGSLLWAAAMKLLQSADKLAEMWAWTAAHPVLVKFTGVIDLLVGLGLILPTAFRIQPKLTIYAAYGMVILMVSAIVFHIQRNEASQIGINIAFGFIALFIAWGRQK